VLTTGDRRAIREILNETKPDVAEYFARQNVLSTP